MNLTEMFSAMGYAAWAVFTVLSFMLIYLIAVSFERWNFFSSNRRKSRQLVMQIRDLFEEEGAGSLEKVGEVMGEYPKVPLANVVKAASDAFSKRTGNLEALDLVVGINRAVERTIERQTTILKKGFGGLATIASIAPFVGLFGTVVGIINAFEGLKEAGGEAGLDVVGGGIAEALIMTAFGLFVAIPAVALYNYFSGVVDKMVVDMGEVASEMVEAVVLRGDKG